MVKHLAFIFAICMVGCATEKQLQKAETKLSQSGRLAKICADRFPSREVVKDSLITDTLLLGEYIFDTIRVNDTVYIDKVQIKTVYKTMYKIVYREKTDKIEALQLELDKARQDLAVANSKWGETIKELQSAQKSAKYRLWWLWIVICLSIGWTFRNFIKRFIP